MGIKNPASTREGKKRIKEKKAEAKGKKKHFEKLTSLKGKVISELTPEEKDSILEELALRFGIL